jgi:flagellar hook-basal body complex protein FliE
MTTSAFAAGAYKSASSLATGGLMPAKPAGDIGAIGGGSDFAKMLGEAVGVAQKAGAKADTQAAAVATGRADIVDVVTAVAESEAAIETLVAVRDRVIAAYEEIMRMPI